MSAEKKHVRQCPNCNHDIKIKTIVNLEPQGELRDGVMKFLANVELEIEEDEKELHDK